MEEKNNKKKSKNTREKKVLRNILSKKKITTLFYLDNIKSFYFVFYDCRLNQYISTYKWTC